MQQQPSAIARGYLIALLSAAILSTTAIFIRYLTLTYGLPPLVLAFWRDTFVTICSLLALGILRPALLRVARSSLGYLAAYGLVLALFNSLWTVSVALNGAAVSTVLAYSSAAFTALLGRWLLREPLTWAKGLAVALCMAGCALVADALHAQAWQTNLPGILTGISSGLCYALYTLMGRSASQRGLSPWTTILYTFGFAAGFLALFNVVPSSLAGGLAEAGRQLSWLHAAWAGWGILLLLAAGPTLIGFGLYNTSLAYLPSGTANLIVTVEPVFTAVTAYFLLGERFSSSQVLGALMIVGGVVLLRLYEGQQSRAAVSRRGEPAEAHVAD
jgi:drug/metabolite transporter (DMT)-like permease